MCRCLTLGSRVFAALLLALILQCPAFAQWAPMNPVTSVQQQPDGLLIAMKTGTLKVQVCSDSIIRVLYSPTTSFPNAPDYVITKTSWPATKWTMQSVDDSVTVTTAKLKVKIARQDAGITYSDVSGTPLVNEASRTMTPVKVNGEDTYRAESFINIYGSREGLYGLGQHQSGVWNYRGESVDISQDNTNIAVPMLVSSKGYGIFWNNDSRSRVNNRFANYLYISSEVANVIDYYFIYGPELDKIVAAYRELTGQAPMFGNGPTVSGNAKIDTGPRKKSWAWRGNIASCTFRSTTSCRTGSGGITKASTSSTRTILTRKAWWTSFTKKIST